MQKALGAVFTVTAILAFSLIYACGGGTQKTSEGTSPISAKGGMTDQAGATTVESVIDEIDSFNVEVTNENGGPIDGVEVLIYQDKDTKGIAIYAEDPKGDYQSYIMGYSYNELISFANEKTNSANRAFVQLYPGFYKAMNIILKLKSVAEITSNINDLINTPSSNPFQHMTPAGDKARCLSFNELLREEAANELLKNAFVGFATKGAGPVGAVIGEGVSWFIDYLEGSSLPEKPPVDRNARIFLETTSYSFNVGGVESSTANSTPYAVIIREIPEGCANVSINDIDTAPPNNPSIAHSNNGVAKSRDVGLKISASDDYGVAGYYISEIPFTPALSDEGWVEISPTTNLSTTVPFTLSHGDGEKVVYVRFTDVAGNISEFASDSVILDTSGDTSACVQNGYIYKTNCPEPEPLPEPELTNVTGATAGDGQVTVTWNTPSDSGNPDNELQSYFLYYQQGGQATYDSPRIDDVWRGATSYIVTGLTNGVEYCFGLTGWRKETRESRMGDQKCATPQASFTYFQTTPTVGNNQATISWDPVSGAASYRVFLCSPDVNYYSNCSATTYDSWSDVSGAITATSYTITNLIGGVSYDYYVPAYDSEGNNIGLGGMYGSFWTEGGFTPTSAACGTDLQISDRLFPDAALGACVMNNATANGWSCANEVTTINCPWGGALVGDLSGLNYSNSFAGGFDNLATLIIDGHSIDDVSPLQGVYSLTKLDLSGNQITDATPLTFLMNLTELQLDGNPIIDVEPLVYGDPGIVWLNSLTTLDLRACQIGGQNVGNVDVLVDLPSVTDIFLGINPNMSCAEATTLINALGTAVDIDNDGTGDLDVPTNGVNCANP